MTSTRTPAVASGLLVCILGLSTALGVETESLPIRLLDSEGQVVPFARVSQVGRTGGVTTDANGSFVLDPEPAPPFDLAVFDQAGVFLGVVRVERLGEGEGRTIYLSPIEKVEVNVRGGIAPSTLAPPAAASTVISRSDTRQRQAPQLVQIIDEAPGTGQVGPGHAAVPSLRGLAGGRTLVLLDSGRVTTERRAGASATFVNPFVVENVEIVRGPGSVVHGSDAIGGIIHATTPSPSPEEFRGQYQLGAGTGINQVTGGLEANLPVGDGGVLVAAYGRDFPNYDSPEGEVDNSGTEGWGMLVKGLVPGEHVRWIAGLQVDRAYDTGKPRRDAIGVKTSYPDEESDRLTLDADLPAPGGFSSLGLQVFLGQYRLVTERDERAGAPAGDVFTSDVDAFDTSVRLLATHSLERGAFRVGFDSRSRFDLSATENVEQYDATGQLVGTLEQASIEDARETGVGLFAEVERELGGGHQSVSAGLRGTYVTTRNSGGLFGNRSTSESTPSGFVAYTFRPVPRWSAVAQVARGFREPALSDRYFAGITGRGFIEGNPDLEPETSLQFDVSAQRTGAMTRIGMFAYLYRIEDVIERFRDTDDVFRFRNRGEQEVRGVEVEWDVDWGSTLAARFTGTWVRGEILDDGSDPDDIPAPSIKAVVYGQSWKRLSWRGAYSYFFRDDHPGPTEAEIPSYGVLDVSVGFEVRQDFEVRVVLGNLLDEAYPASADDDSVLAPGRNAALLLSGTF